MMPVIMPLMIELSIIVNGSLGLARGYLIIEGRALS